MNTDSLEDLKALDYPVTIEYDREDSLYVAEFVDLPGCSATGFSVAEAYNRAQDAKAEWLRLALEQGLPIPKPSKAEEYSGRILVRLPASLHAMLASRARRNGASLNQYIVHVLSAGSVGEKASSDFETLMGHVQEVSGKLEAMLGGMHQIEQQVAGMSSQHFTSLLAGTSEHSEFLACQRSLHQTPGPVVGRMSPPNARESARIS